MVRCFSKSPPIASLAFVVVWLHLAVTPSSGESQLSRSPYLQLATEESITILWRTVGASQPGLRFGAAPDQLSNVLPPAQILIRVSPDLAGEDDLSPLHSAPVDTFQYEATISGLQPGTKYFYAVYDDGQELVGADADHYFEPLPTASAGEPLRLWVVGDSGTGEAAPIAVFEAMQSYVIDDGRPVDGFLHLGDMAYEEGLDEEFTANFFEVYSTLLRNTVTWPTMGNHEGDSSSGALQEGPYYDAYVLPKQAEAGGLASGTEAYYSFDIGAAHFICLDSDDLDRSITGDMALWLKDDLEMTNSEWLIAFWHHPPYSKGTHDSDGDLRMTQMREFIVPLLESGGVDLILSGHSHVYERSMLLDGATVTPTVPEGVILDDGDGDPAGHGAYRKSALLNPNGGTVAVVSGNGGRSAQVEEGFGRSPVMRKMILGLGSLIIDIAGDTLTGTMIDSAAEVRDVFQIVKQGIVIPEIVSYPWQPSGPRYRLQKESSDSPIVAEVFAVPAAPDATIYYTTDGSQPMLDSSIYTGPIEISAAQRLRAMSVWRGGERVSPTSEAEPLKIGVSRVQAIGSAADDGQEFADGTVDLSSDQLTFGADGIVGVRVVGIDLPEDIYLVRADIQFEAVEVDLFSSTGEIWGELSDDSPPFTGVTHDFSSRPRTRAVTRWTPGGWLLGNNGRSEQTSTADLSNIVSELTSRPQWQSGNAMSFFFSQSGRRTAAAYDAASFRGASLFFWYIEPSGLADRLASQNLTIRPLDDGDYRLAFRWPVRSVQNALGLSYVIEASRDLQDWEGVDPLGVVTNFLGEISYVELQVRIGSEELAGGRQFLRLKISQSP